MTVWGQNGDDCSKGDDNPQEVSDPTTEQVGEAKSTIQYSYDPNEIIGPVGYDSMRWVSINDVLNYTILFENDPEFATAAAQKVDVRFNFPNKAWMKGFGIGGYSFANMSFPVAKPSNAYQQRIDLRDSLGYYVDLIGGLDVARQQGFWTFSTIDPETGYAPWQSEMGLLPVNDETHVGEGFVTFQLNPYEGLKTGDTISIQANIVFDQNDTIPTNRWCNKIDAGMPESKVSADPLSSPEGEDISAYNLTFTAKDDEGGSGIKHILLYMANHNGIYEEIDTVAVDSILLFPVETGKQYKLYSIAVDNTGNREPAKMEPDVILNFNLAPTDIALSDTIFQDDLAAGGYVGKLTSVDTEDNKTFIYALAEGEGAVHNDLFQITDDMLQIKNTFKCAEDSIYKVRISTTDEGGLSFSKAFVLYLENVLEKPKADSLEVNICEGETCLFHGYEYDQTGIYAYSKSNEFMCDSVYVLKLTVLPRLDAPLVTVEGINTLVSSAAKNNQWFREDGTPIEGATEQKFTPDEDGIYYVAVSNGACYSEPSQLYRVQLTDKIDLQLDLAEGWNWISSNLSDAKYRSATGFLSPVIDNVDAMDGTNNGLVNGEGGLSGTLTEIAPEESYKLKMNNSVTGEWNGIAYQPENTPLSLHKGWNWIGYVPVGEKTLSDALSKLSPSDNDVIKTQDEFAIYSGGLWKGTLTSMKPGEGYMYYSEDSKQLVYPVTRVFAVDNNAMVKQAAQEGVSPWNYNKNAYRDNMTMIAELYVDSENDESEKALEGVFSVGAFSGDECRGIGTYIDGLLYLTIHGTLTDKEAITFKAYEIATAKNLKIKEKLNFEEVQKGTVSEPFPLHVKDGTGIQGISASAFNIYPNPVRNTMYIEGNTESIQDVTILTTDGRIVIRTDKYTNAGINVTSLLEGVYIVALHTSDGSYLYKKILKVN